MNAVEEVTSVFDAVRRAGLLDPFSVAALTSSTALRGPSLAAGYTAAALRYPNRIAIIDDYGSLSYRRLEQRTERVAASLRQIGVERDSVVGVNCRNHRGFVEALIAVTKIGAKPVLLNTGLPDSQLHEVVQRENISLVIADRDLPTGESEGVRVLASAPEEDPEWSFPDLPPTRSLIPGREWLRFPRPFEPSQPMMLTSGTTGAPKGTRRSLDPKAGLGVIGFVEAIPYARGDVMVIPAPLFHAWGFSQMVLAATLAGTIVIRRRFDPQQVLDDLEVNGATVLAAVPVMLHRLLENERDMAEERSSDEPDQRDLSALRIVATSGSALPSRLATEWMDYFGDNLYNLYGSTEAGQVSVAGPEDLRRDPTTAGRPLRGTKVRIVGPDDHEVPIGNTGEILIESANRFDGYTDGGNKRTLPADDGGGEMMSTGDRGHVDSSGLLYVHGRADDMIVSGGENVFPENIERCLRSHEIVSDVAVVGVADADLGHKVRAVIVTNSTGKPATRTKALKAHLRPHLAKHEMPREFVYVSELTRNPAGKVRRSQLTGSRRSIPYKQQADNPRGRQ